MLLHPLLAILTAQPTVFLPSNQDSLQIESVLAIPQVGHGGRVPFPTDAVEKLIVEGKFETPRDGDGVELANGQTALWKEAKADKDGKFSGDAFNGGYAFCQVDSEKSRVMLLTAPGDSMVYVNGEPRVGDPYGYGWVTVPVKLHVGVNSLLFLTGRGDMNARLDAPKKPVFLANWDTTLPDVITGSNSTKSWGGAVVVNASDEPAEDLEIGASSGAGNTPYAPVKTIPPLSVCKAPFPIWAGPEAKGGDYDLSVHLRLSAQVSTLNLPRPQAVDDLAAKIRYRTPLQTRKETYLSEVDDSLQYYAVNPPPDPKPGLAMMLSLHGAGVEAIGQADAYSPKDWAYVVCATNRRPFGFDWEDWGREDGADVLGIAEKEYKTDPAHTYVTGHSMGGHGTWQFGALFPDHWAAIGVSAGWASFFSYVGVTRSDQPTPMLDIFQRANGTSDTLAMKNNFRAEGVFILHGDKDDNVPVSEARAMRKEIGAIQPDLGYHEQPGAGHWWSTPLTKGATCLELPDMMDFLKRHAIQRPRDVDFTTCSLAASSSFDGVKVLQQSHPLAPSRIQVSAGANVVVKTDNIDRFSLPSVWNDVGLPIVVNGLATTRSDSGIYMRESGRFVPSSDGRCAQVGPFKQAFNNHAVLVYGTLGSDEETEANFAKARYDSESFWYRGNGALQVMSDKEFLKLPPGARNAILYGNKDTNGAWNRLFGKCPLQVSRGLVRAGKESFRRDDLACLFCWRAPGQRTLNAAVCGTGAAGMRLTYRVPYFVSGVGLPDWTLDTPDSLSKGLLGVMGAGYFAPDGGLDDGDHAWAK